MLTARSILRSFTLALMIAGCGPTVPSVMPPLGPSQGAVGPTSTAAASPSVKPPAWSEPADYTFVMESSCGERSLIGRFRVHVVDHVTVEIERLDPAAQVFPGDARDVPTLGAVLAEASEARDGGADIVDVTLDPVDGHPTRVAIDRKAETIDDEACYAISEYVSG